MSRWIHGIRGVSPYEFLEEHGGSGGTSVAGTASVHDVGDRGFDLVAIVVGAGHAPEFFAGD